MTPAAMRIVSQMRQEFYSLFAASMDVPVSIINSNAQTSNLARASWVDDREQLNYVCVYAYTAPDELVPERPLVLRLAINKGADSTTVAKRGKSSQGLNHKWHFELTLLPEEVLGFLPWLISLITSHDRGSVSCVPEPPYPIDFTTSDALPLPIACTHKASNMLSRQLLPSQKQATCVTNSQRKQFK